MGFAVLHIEKGTAGKAGGLGSHIDRTKKVLNADPKLSEKNFYVRTDFDKGRIYPTMQREAKPLQERIDARIKDGYKGKTAIRKDAVTHLNIVLSGSHDDMQRIAKSSDKLIEWALQNAKFIGEKFGFQNIVEFGVHLDERTPHIHCVVVPLTKDGRLSAKEMMGDRRKMSQLQEDYGKAMQERFGLQRGIKGSTATHDSVREYYARINECMSSMANEGIKIPEVFITPPQIDIPPLMGRENWAKKQNQAIYKAFSSGAKDIIQKIQKRDTAQIRDENNSKMKLTEANQRLKKENAQLHAIIKRQDKELHPERYIKTDKGYTL